MTRESMEFDFVIVGAGPSGLACAIRLAQLSKQHGKDYSICVLEKGAEVGAHLLSGAAIDPKALNELIPDWKNLDAPLHTAATEDQFVFLTKESSFRLPTPRPLRNKGCYIISLGNLGKWLAQQAENLGVQIFPGFAASNLIFDDHNRVVGVTTGDKGIDKHGKPTALYQPGMDLYAKQIILAEGCRGSLTKQIIKHYQLANPNSPPTYGIGIKELWEVSEKQHKPGLVFHSLGWPLDQKTYGGSFLYHLENRQVAVGFVIGLDYQNPFLDPYEEFQRFKTHPKIRSTFENAKRLCYGARALNEGGWQSLPKLSFPGGLLIGDAAGFLNVPRIKGIHMNMKSGMIAAETIAEHWDHLHTELADYNQNIKNSWLGTELFAARNIRPAFKWGLVPGLMYSAIDSYVFNGRAPWTLKHHSPDYASLKNAANAKVIDYPAHDGKLTFDKLTSVYFSNTRHEENQPCHLQLADPQLAIDVNLKLYDSPETRYCPAKVYEIVDRDTQPRLQINAANCVHCKTCDIKDPCQNINWVPPEGGDGPNYSGM